MPAVKLLNLLALSALVLLACSLGFTPVDALSSRTGLVARDIPAHQAVAKRKRNITNPQKRCQSRPTTTTLSSSSSASPVANAAMTPPTTIASPTPSPSPPPPPPPPSNNGGGKAGIAWPNLNDPALHYYKTWKTTRLYTWNPWIPQEAMDLGFDVIPMLWGYNQIYDFQRLVLAGYAHTVLGMNEPNELGQSSMNPWDGARLWQQYIQPLAGQGYSLISPATSSNPNGLQWMQNFFGACGGCTFDGVAVHWYDVSAQAFIDYITLWHDTFGKPIWVTEFACQNFNGGPQCSQDEVYSFMATVTGFMDNTEWVVAYFAFGVMHNMQGVNPANQLMSGDGSPTPLGYKYIYG